MSSAQVPWVPLISVNNSSIIKTNALCPKQGAHCCAMQISSITLDSGFYCGVILPTRGHLTMSGDRSGC